LSDTWQLLTGSEPKRDKNGKLTHLIAHLGNPDGPQATIELYPGKGGQDRLVLRDFTPVEGDEDYLEGLQMVADFAQKLKTNGINSELKVSDDYSDAESIKTDVGALLTPTEEEQKVA
jgi:hypothetical protein